MFVAEGSNRVPLVMIKYFAGSTMTPVWPWFPPPSMVGMLVAVAINSFSRVVMSLSFGCPKICWLSLS